MHLKKVALCLAFVTLATRTSEKVVVDEIATKVDSEISVEVFENGTTGYLWFYLTQGKEDLVKLVRKEVVPEPKKEKRLVGAGHSVRFIFRAHKPGSYLINLVYKRLWENDVAEYKTVRVNVTA